MKPLPSLSKTLKASLISSSLSVLHLSGHHGEELGEINGSVTIGIDFVDHVLKFSLCRILAKRSHHCSKLLGGDCAIAILVEQGECLFELSDLLLSQLVSHFWILISQSLR